MLSASNGADIQKANREQQLIASFKAIGKNPKLATAGDGHELVLVEERRLCRQHLVVEYPVARPCPRRHRS